MYFAQIRAKYLTIMKMKYLCLSMLFVMHLSMYSNTDAYQISNVELKLETENDDRGVMKQKQQKKEKKRFKPFGPSSLLEGNIKKPGASRKLENVLEKLTIHKTNIEDLQRIFQTDLFTISNVELKVTNENNTLKKQFFRFIKFGNALKKQKKPSKDSELVWPRN